MQLAVVAGVQDLGQVDRQAVARHGLIALAAHVEHRLHPQRPAGGGGLLERRRKPDREAGERAVDADLALTLGHLQVQRVGRLALEVRAQCRQPAQLARLAQALGACDTLAVEADAAVLLRAAVEARLAAQYARGRARHLETLVGESDAAARLAQQRRTGRDLHLVAEQGQLPIDARLLHLRERDAQVQLQLGLTAAARLGQRLRGPLADRRFLDETQRIAERAAALAAERQHGATVQVGDAALHLGQLEAEQARPGIPDLHRAALEHQLPAHLGERRPGRGLQRVAGREREGGVVDLGGDAELPMARVAKGEVMEVALHQEVHRAGAAGQHRPPHIVAHRGRQAGRQVAPGARGVGPLQLAPQVEHAGQADLGRAAVLPAGAPGRAQGPRGVGIGETGVAHLQLDAGRGAARRVALQPPLQVGSQPVQRDAGFLEHAGEHQLPLPHAQRGCAAPVGGGDREVGAGQAGAADARGLAAAGLLGRQLQPLELPLHAIAHGRVERPLPAQLQVLHQALRAHLGEVGAQSCAERQAAGQACQDREVEPVGLQLPAREGPAGRLLPAQRAAGRRPVLPVAGAEGQPGRRGAVGLALTLAGQAAGQALQHQRRQLGRQPHMHGLQREVGGGAAELAVAHVGPDPQGARAFAQFERQRHILAQALHVGLRQLGIGTAAPAPDVTRAGQQRMMEPSAQRETGAPVGRRRGIDAPVVAPRTEPGAVAQHQVHVGQLQRRRALELIDPAQRAAADRQLVLAEDPVGGRRVTLAPGLAAHLQPGHEQPALDIAAHLQARAIDDQLLEARLPVQQRAGRQGRVDPSQAQRLAPAGVADQDVSQFQRRHPAVRFNTDVADLHRHPQGSGGRLLDLRAPRFDSRQNRPMQNEPGHQQQAPGEQDEDSGNTHGHAKKAPGRRQQGRGGEKRHEDFARTGVVRSAPLQEGAANLA
ncbi:hypothetical protein OOT46_02130 [Aquabacterium sp. A7-Y]|nr:hypothetical protein [Aquabacterium sp. A7-Y]MCW7536655.1 hypothetical protein [Aquabacterium sp. A7-Y]